jgi:hypothetical protein
VSGCKSCGPATPAPRPAPFAIDCAPQSCAPAGSASPVHCALRSPLIEARAFAHFRDALAANRAGYTPEWYAPLGTGDAGEALVAILPRQLEIQAGGLNAMPLRMQLEYLEKIGASLLPAQSARAPLVFKLLDTATGDATVPAGTRVAAVLPPPAPSLDSDTAPARSTAPEFFTEQEILAMRGKLAAVYSIDPNDDVYTDHTAASKAGFSLFTHMKPVPHRLYLGHGELFKFTGPAQIDLTFDFATTQADERSLQRPLLFDWEYLSVDGWLPLTLVQDITTRFTRDGKMVLAKFSGPDAKEDTVNGHGGYWIRGTVSSRVPSARVVKAPAAGKLEVEVEHTRELLPGDIVTVDGVTRARITGTTGTSVILEKMPGHVRPGEFLLLADALPPLRPDGADAEGILPRVDVIRARVGFARSDLPLDGAYLDAAAIDIGKDFYPFGTQPERFAAFYIACKDAFSRRGARIELAFSFAELGGTAGAPKVDAEYYDGTRWRAIGPDEDYINATESFTKATDQDAAGRDSATVAFNVPEGWEQAGINGDTNYWLRFRLASGDYGRPLDIQVEPDPNDSSRYIVKTTPATLQPPTVAELRVSYLVFSNPTPLDHCVTENDFAFADHGEDARWPRSPFMPFVPVSDRASALHIGFDARPPSGLVSLLAVVDAPAEQAAAQPFAWDYWGSRGWTELSVRDVTQGFSRTGLIQFVGAPDAEPRDGLGGKLYRIRARLKSGLANAEHAARLRGVWLNAVWAAQGTRYQNDRLGTSDGNPDQTFALPSVRANAGKLASADTVAANDVAEFNRALTVPATGVPVLKGEEVWVREWTGRGDDWETAVGEAPAGDLRFEVDPRDPTVKTAAWVRWHAQPHLYASKATDRHCVVERARGIFRFPGIDGFVPPAGCPISVTYVTGGGVAGNVPEGAIRELHSGVGFIESVTNPLAAGGGAEAERLRDARDRSAQAVRNRDRAVSAEDFEWLARQASAEVVRARALPLEGAYGRGSRGIVGIVLVPQSNDALPRLSRELSARVLDYLAARVPAGIAGGVRILEPTYASVSVRAEIIPVAPEDAARVEARVRTRLNRFLHPLTGGRDGSGWEFGATVYLSDIAALLEDTPGVDAVQFVQLMAGASVHGEYLTVSPDQLPAAGDSQLKLIVPSARYVLA